VVKKLAAKTAIFAFLAFSQGFSKVKKVVKLRLIFSDVRLG
jgi:hypothetical protein